MFLDLGTVGSKNSSGQFHSRTASEVSVNIPITGHKYTSSMGNPFGNIGRSLTGSQRRDLCRVTKDLYLHQLNDILEAGLNKVSMDEFIGHPKFQGENKNSLNVLKMSFNRCDKVSRNGDVRGNVARLTFRFISDYKTIDGKDIRLNIPIMVKYRDSISWAVLMPSFEIGGE